VYKKKSTGVVVGFLTPSLCGQTVDKNGGSGFWATLTKVLRHQSQKLKKQRR
jgi:hypothetical protein